MTHLILGIPLLVALLIGAIVTPTAGMPSQYMKKVDRHVPVSVD